MDYIKTVGNYLEYCKYCKRLSPHTLKAYRIDLRQFFQFTGLREIQKTEIEEYIVWLHKNYKQRTVKRKIASIKAFYKYLEEEDILKDENPFYKVRIKFKETIVLPRIIPRNIIEKLLKYMYAALKKAGDDMAVHRDLAVIEMFFATGARVYEVSHMRIQDMDLNSGVIRIMGKGRKERYVQIGSAAALELMRQYYWKNREIIERCGFFFVNRNGCRYSEQSIRNMLRKYTNLAAISSLITPHMFRHSVATYLLEEGVDVMFIKEMLGHSSVKTTQIYLHIASKKQMEILRRMHPRNKMVIEAA